MGDVTQMLSQISDGDPDAPQKLLELVYDELRKLATQKMAKEDPGQTLQATALVHEAYMRLVDSDGAHHWNGRAHFFAAAAEAMRRILVEQARRKKSQKAGGDRRRIPLSDIELQTESPQIDVLELNEALARLEAQHPRKAKLVKLRFFTGLTIPQVAEAIGVSTSTANEDWAYAKCWLRAQMSENTCRRE